MEQEPNKDLQPNGQESKLGVIASFGVCTLISGGLAGATISAAERSPIENPAGLLVCAAAVCGFTYGAVKEWKSLFKNN